MALEASFALLAFGPPLMWASALWARGRLSQQRALFAFLAFSGLFGAMLMLVHAAGLIVSARHYFLLYLVGEIGSLALLAAALLELVALSLSAYPRFQRAATRLVNGLLIACVVGAISIVFVPQSWITSARHFHLAERTAIEIGLPLVWAAFWLGGRYFGFQPNRRISAEGSLLALLLIGYAAIQIWNPSWGRMAHGLWSAACFGSGAVIAFRWSTNSNERPETLESPTEEAPEEVREALARLDILHRSLDAAGK